MARPAIERLTSIEGRRRAKLSRQRLFAGMAAGVVLAAAITAAIAQRSAAYQVGFVESIASASASFLAQIGTGLPFGYAFAAGMVAAVNPCGFALLPAYLGLYLGTERSVQALPHRLLRAAGVGLVVSASFVILFGAAGVLVAATTSGIIRFFPWIGLLVGVVLVAVGAASLAGVSPYLGVINRLGDRVGATARDGGLIGYAGFGVAYAAGSLGCTLPIFLSVVAAGTTSRGPAGALLQFVLYGLGMGSVLAVLALAAALAGQGALRTVRRFGAYLQSVGAIVLLLAGGYVVYYWLSAGESFSASADLYAALELNSIRCRRAIEAVRPPRVCGHASRRKPLGSSYHNAPPPRANSAPCSHSNSSMRRTVSCSSAIFARRRARDALSLRARCSPIESLRSRHARVSSRISARVRPRRRASTMYRTHHSASESNSR